VGLLNGPPTIVFTLDKVDGITDGVEELVVNIHGPSSVKNVNSSSGLLPKDKARAIMPPIELPDITSKYFHNSFGVTPHKSTKDFKKLAET
jgi:hypothetical protein